MEVKKFIRKINAIYGMGLEILTLEGDEIFPTKYYWRSIGARIGDGFPTELEALYDWLTAVKEFTLLNDDEDDDEEF